MSLVGSLEDLGLGDILQIVSLSRKSGLLQLRSDSGDGRIVVRDGLVCGAFVKGGAEDLRGLLVGGGFVSADQFEKAEARARARGEGLPAAISEVAGLAPERLDSLRREHVERVVMDIFGWRSGEFSFEVREEFEDCDPDLLHPAGINAQYLAMEATRLGDEQRGSSAAEGSDLSVDPSDESSVDDALDAALGAASDPGEAAGIDAGSGAPGGTATDPASDAHELVALAAARRAEDAGPARSGETIELTELHGQAPAGDAPAPEPSAPRAPPALVVIDPELPALEWLKAELGGDHPRIHIFQRSDGGVARIRQYLRRGELPLVLVAAHASGDPLTGSNDLFELVRRLRVQAPGMAVVVLCPEDADPGGLPAADAVVPRPAACDLADASAWSGFAAAASRIREALRVASEKIPASPGDAEADDSETRKEAPTAALERLRAFSRRLRDPESRGEVLSLVLQFAAEHFARVAIFLLRDDRAEGVAQLGLSGAGGPDDTQFRGIDLSARDPAWFRKVIERREPWAGPPDGAGDRWLGALLGDALPDAAYVAPIESCDRVVALLYGDNLPDRRPLGDTSALEIVLHEAGLALDRAALERALGEPAG